MLTYPGVAPAMALTTDLVVGSVPPEKAGGASGLATTANDLGISLGIAVIGSIGIATYRSQITQLLPGGLPADATAAASRSIDGALTTAAELPGALGGQLVTAAQQAFTGGLNTAAIVSAVIAAIAALVAATRLRHIRPTGHAHPSPPEAAPVEEYPEGV